MQFTARLAKVRENKHRNKYIIHKHEDTLFTREKDSEAVLGAWLLAPLPTPRALPDHGALWPLAVGVEKYLGGIDV